MTIKRTSDEGTFGDPEAVEYDGLAATPSAQVLRTSPDVFQAALGLISPQREPARWAATQLQLGVTLRARAGTQGGAQQLTTWLAAIDAFEAALSVFCHCGPASSAADETARRRPARADDRAASDRCDGVDLVIGAMSQPFLEDTEALEEAIRLFRSHATASMRERDFSTWLTNGINTMCVLTMLGKRASTEGDTAQLEEAVDLGRSLLADPALAERTYECAMIGINLAAALQCLGELAFPHERLKFLSRAADALAQALSAVAPPHYRSLFQTASCQLM